MQTKISEQFWADPVIEEQPPEVKLAALWLMTNSALTVCGFQIVSKRRFEFETGLPAEVLGKALEALPHTFEAHGKGLWVVNYVKWQVGSGERLAKNNIAKSIVLQVNATGIPSFVERFAEVYPVLADYLDFSVGAPAKGLGSPSEGLQSFQSPPQGEREGEGEGEGKEKQDRDSKGKGAEQVALAERIYAAYPRKVGKPAGLKAILKALKKIDAATLLRRTETYAWQRSGEDPQFTPHPATWFGQERFNDIADQPPTPAGDDTVIRASSERWVKSWDGVPPSIEMARDLLATFPAAVQREDVYEICAPEFGAALREFVSQVTPVNAGGLNVVG